MTESIVEIILDSDILPTNEKIFFFSIKRNKLLCKHMDILIPSEFTNINKCINCRILDIKKNNLKCSLWNHTGSSQNYFIIKVIPKGTKLNAGKLRI